MISYFEKFLAGRRGIYHTLTTDYDPQANSTGERTVGLFKAISARCLSSASIDPSLFWDHLADQGSHVLCPPEGEHDDPLVYKAGLPVLSPPGVPDSTLDAKARDDAKEAESSEKKKQFDTPLLPGSDEPLDLDPTGQGLMDTFTFLYLSSEDCRDATFDAEAQGLTGEEVHDTKLSPDNNTTEEEKRNQATTHINVTSDEVCKSTGKTHRKWLSTGENEISNLTSPRSGDHKTGALSTIALEKENDLKNNARAKGRQHMELPAKVVWTMKTDFFKCRIVACGNQTQDTYGRTSTTDLDSAMLRFILSWAASSPDNSLASLDITAAFLNAELPPGRVEMLRPPTILYRLGLLPSRFCWRVPPCHLWPTTSTKPLV